MMCNKQVVEEMIHELAQAQMKCIYLVAALNKALDEMDFDETVEYRRRMQEIVEMA